MYLMILLKLVFYRTWKQAVCLCLYERLQQTNTNVPQTQEKMIPVSPHLVEMNPLYLTHSSASGCPNLSKRLGTSLDISIFHTEIQMQANGSARHPCPTLLQFCTCRIEGLAKQASHSKLMQTPCLIPITQNEAEGGIWEIMSIAVCQLNMYFPLQTGGKVNIYMKRGKC